MKSGFSRTMLALVILAAVSGCAGGGQADNAGSDTPPLTAAERAAAAKNAAAASNAFAIDLFHELNQADENLFFSPASISLALAMTWAGAAGITATEMADVLHLEGDEQHVHESFAQLQALMDDPEAVHTLRIANRLWGQVGYDFLADFLDLVQRNYAGGLERLDFEHEPEASRIIINDWVAEQTEQKIQDLIAEGLITDLTRLVLTNAIYFLADWEHTFPAESTAPEDFHLADGATAKVPTMKQQTKLGYAENDQWQMVALPYAGGELEFLVMVPKGKEQQISGELIEQLSRTRSQRQVTCWLPSFKLETSFELNDVLKKLGMPTAFDQVEADFSSMTGRDDLYISQVVHKAFIEVDEEGTEAAAATAVIMNRKSSMPPPPVDFKADRPFTFVIRHMESDAILFMGRCTDPR